MNPRLRLTALVVNYNTGAFAVGCVQSLLDEWRRAGRPRERLHVVVVDNDSPLDQGEDLDRLEELGAEVVRHDDNAGYARGMNLAYARAKETAPREDVVAILNPDIYFLPGSVEKLLGYVLEHPECGVVDARACIDPLGVFNLPRNLLPTVGEHVRVGLAQMSPFLCRLYSRRRLRLNLPWWRADGPIRADMLSGCCLFMRREVADELPQLLDERYPLYYEDTDLFRTLAGMGYTVVHHGGARILHHWSRSAGTGGGDDHEPSRRYHVSQKAYYTKFSGAVGRRIVRVTNALVARWPGDKVARPMHHFEHLGGFDDPVELRFPRSCNYLVELGISQTYILAAGVFGSGDRWSCPREAWEWLPGMRFYLRAIDLDRDRLLGAWSFDKCQPGRSSAMDAEELSRYGTRLWGVAV